MQHVTNSNNTCTCTCNNTGVVGIGDVCKNLIIKAVDWQ